MSENKDMTMNELLEDYGVSKIRTGDIVKGTVISVNSDFITVNLNYKSDGLITKEEYSNKYVEDLSKEINEGDTIEAYVIKLSDQDGNVVLSRKIIEERANWKKIEKLKQQDLIFDTKIIDSNDYGAFAIIEDIKGFIPKNQISLNRQAKPEDFLGKNIKVKILDTKNKKGRRQLILSSRIVEKEEKEKKENEIWNSLEINKIYEGTVKNIQDYGAFVNINGIDGLLHINEIAWVKIKHPSEVLKKGDKIEVMVKKLDIENKKLSLSYKATMKSPWQKFSENYSVNDLVDGKIVRITDFGAFVNIDDIECLLHVKDISWLRIDHPSDVLKEGDEVSAKILNINRKDRKVKIGIKQLSKHPFDKFVENVSNNDIIKVKVKRIVADGVYVDINDDLESFIHISKISRDKLRTPAKVVKINEERDAKIIGIDRRIKKIKLSFILNEQEENKFSNGNEPVSYTLGDDSFTIGDLINKD